MLGKTQLYMQNYSQRIQRLPSKDRTVEDLNNALKLREQNNNGNRIVDATLESGYKMYLLFGLLYPFAKGTGEYEPLNLL